MKGCLRGLCAMLVLALIAMSGCTPAPDASSETAPKGTGAIQDDGETSGGKKHLVIQADFDRQGTIVDSFLTANPDITVEWVYNSEFLKGLKSASPPDLIIISNDRIRDMNDLDIFEDLSGPPYDAVSHLQTWFPELNLEPFRSLDGNRLISVPKDVSLNFTFYRADILQKYGFPAEPEELARYLEDPQRWQGMAKTLRAHNHWIFSYPSDPVYVVSNSLGFFGKDRSFPRNTAQIVETMDMLKEIAKSGLARNLNIWDDNGKRAIADGEIVMLYLGEWAQFLLKQWDPVHENQWKMTRLPLGRFSTQGGVAFMIPKNGKNKREAWTYAQHSMKEEAGYRDSLQSRQWYGRLEPRWVTPLDRRAEEIWNKEVMEAQQDDDKSSVEILSSIEEKVTSALNKELINMHEVLSGK